MTPWFSAPIARLASIFAGGLLAVACSTAPVTPSRSVGAATAPAGPTPSAVAVTPAPTIAATAVAVQFDVASVALGPEGTLYGSACDAARVVRFDDGGPMVIAGSGPRGFAAGFEGDGHLATLAQIQCPQGLVVTADGITVADHGNNRIRFIDTLGLIRTIAGSGATGSNNGSFSGDGGDSTKATLQEPTFLLLGRDGLYVADRDNNRVRRIDAHGTISTVAGTGAVGFVGDGGPAIAATLDNPAGMAMDAAGNLYIADSNNNRIRRVDPKGRITTIAGTGASGSGGDGGPAAAATMADPEGLAIGPDGSLYVGEAEGNRIRRIDAHGTISTFAGTGAVGYAGDGGPASAATLAVAGSEVGIAMDHRGNLYIPDLGNHCIRKVDPAGIITTFART
jgi:hypothetical protein